MSTLILKTTRSLLRPFDDDENITSSSMAITSSDGYACHRRRQRAAVILDDHCTRLPTIHPQSRLLSITRGGDSGF